MKTEKKEIKYLLILSLKFKGRKGLRKYPKYEREKVYYYFPAGRIGWYSSC